MQSFILSDCVTVRSIWYLYDNMSSYYLKPWPINQSWHCWDSFDTKRCILAHFERCFCKLKMMRKCWKQGQ